MNEQLFERIKDQVMAEPKSLNMKYFCRFQSKSDNVCGTVGCIGGWAMLLMGLRKPLKAYRDWQNGPDTTTVPPPQVDEYKVAAALLGIPMSEAKLLFYFYAHPNDESHPYRELAEKLSGHREGSVKYAKVVCEAINLCMYRGNNGEFAND